MKLNGIEEELSMSNIIQTTKFDNENLHVKVINKQGK